MKALRLTNEPINITVGDLLLEHKRRKYRRIDYFWNTDQVRAGYKKHLEFIAATNKYREVCFLAGNRTGKSETGAFCVATWLTGEYPEWWHGRRFEKPTNILVAGETAKLVRDSMQIKLLGAHEKNGTGFIPKDKIISVTARAGVPDGVDTVRVRHVNGGVSILQFQSYDQGRKVFQATARDVIWEDEEPDLEIHTECLLRTMTTNGLVLQTFTPLKGMTEMVMAALKKQTEGKAAVVTASWDDAPHLSDADKAELEELIPPHQRDARIRGIPQLGSGAVYPVDESVFVVEPFEIPPHFKRAYGMDVGWNFTAAVWGAHDVEADILYVFADYKRSHSEPAVHAASINARGVENGAIDPASRGRQQADGKQLLQEYVKLGLNLIPADNAVEAGIFDAFKRMTTGRLKIFSTCKTLLEELRLYRRNDKGHIVKENDHCCDAMRYLIRSGLNVAEYGNGYINPAATNTKPSPYKPRRRAGWMSA